MSYCINVKGYKPLQKKVKAIINYPKPKTVEELRRFLGIINFYRGCIPKAAHSQFHLNKFLKGAKKKDKTVIKWDEASETAFKECKDKIAKCALLNFPCDEAELRLVTDASDLSMGATLEQRVNSKWELLAFFSKKFSPAQSKYSTYD